MDFSDINKVASRKRVCTDAEKLREKMSRESSKIIKLRVAQDTAYWDLKERLSSVQAEHERLQQNMLDVQMQHEALSAQYQDELRLRPETLNKLASTRDICDVLEEYAGRVRASLRGAGADRDALARAYAGAARRLQAQHALHARTAAAAQLQATAAADQLKLSAEHNSQLMTCASDARRQAEATLEAASQQLQAAAQREELLQKQVNEQRDRTASLHADLQQREWTIAELQRKAERRAVESAAEAERAARDRTELERKVEEGGVELGATRDALAAAEVRITRGVEEVARLGADIQKLEKIIADLELELKTVKAENETLQKKLQEKEREVTENAARVEAMRVEAGAVREQLRAEREARAQDAAAAGAAAEEAERALGERADTVARLMRDVAAEAEARARSDAALHVAGDQARALVDKLQIKEGELAGQMKIVLEMRSEKERLQDIIHNMQGTIDNIQKALTREAAASQAAAAAASAARHEPPEHDDNALPAPPKPLRQCVQTPVADGGVFLTPLPRNTNSDDLLYHLLSDSSMDADALDPREINARFEALSRGTVPPATSLNALKRRHVERAQGGTAANADVSQSQVKTELAARGRTFFRNKRLDAKTKKFK